MPILAVLGAVGSGLALIAAAGTIAFMLDHEFSADMIGYRFYPATLAGAIAAVALTRAMLRARVPAWALGALGAVYLLLPALAAGFLLMAGCAMSGGGCRDATLLPYIAPALAASAAALLWLLWRTLSDARSRPKG